MKSKKPPHSSSFAWFERGAYASPSVRRYLTSEFHPEQVKNIAVIRHAALGDQVITRPFLIEARKFFPNAKITLVSVSNYQYATPSDLADLTLVMHGKDRKANTSFKDKITNIKELGQQDIVFDIAGTNRSYWMTALTKAKIKFGFPYKPWLCGLLYNAAVFRSDFQAEVEVMLDMLRFLGHTPPSRLDFGYPDHQNLGEKEKPYFIYFNGASQPSKVLKDKQMAELLERAIEVFPNIRHVFLEGVKDNEKGDYLSHLTNHDNFEIQACLPLDQLLDFTARSRLVVAPDTGIRNVAISTHTPTVGIFYSTVPFRYTPRYEPIHMIVMNADASVPSTTDIISAIKSSQCKSL